MVSEATELVGKAAKDSAVRFSVDALIRAGSQALLLRRDPEDFLGGLWELPFGPVEDGVSIEDAAVGQVT